MGKGRFGTTEGALLSLSTGSPQCKEPPESSSHSPGPGPRAAPPGLTPRNSHSLASAWTCQAAGVALAGGTHGHPQEAGPGVQGEGSQERSCVHSGQPGGNPLSESSSPRSLSVPLGEGHDSRILSVDPLPTT